MADWLKYFLLLLLIVVFPAVQAATIKGEVVDKTNRTPVAGATIRIIENNKVVISDQNGFFSFRNVPIATYHIYATAVGYQPDSFSISVQAEKQLALHLALQPIVHALNEVSVTTAIDPGTEQYSRQQEQRSVPLVNSLSRQSIVRSSDLTMADVLQRASGVSLSANESGASTRAIIRGMDSKYSYTAINGIPLPSPDDRSRYVALDLFPANMIERLEVYKTLTPGMPGDAIGGLMNIVTRQVPAAEQFSVRLATGYDQLFFQRQYLTFNSNVIERQSPYEKYGDGHYAQGTDFTKDNLSFHQKHPLPNMQGDIWWGKKFLKQKLGIVAEAGMQNMQQGSNSFLIVQNNEPQLNNVPGITDFTQRHYSISSFRTYFYTAADYRFNATNSIRLDQFYTAKKDNEARDWVDTSLAEGRSGPGTGRIAFSQRSRQHLQSLYHLNLQGVHTLSTAWKLNWYAVYSHAYGSYPDWAELTANTGRIKGADDVVYQTPVLLAPLNRIWLHNTENEKDLSAKLNYVPAVFRNSLSVTGGTLLQYRNRSNFFNEYFFNPAYTDSTGQPFTNIYDAQWYNNNGPQNPLGNTNTPGTYTAKENISAFFAEANIHIKQLDIVTGLRNEHTLQLLNAVAAPTDNTGNEVKVDYYDWLPSMHVRYALTPKQAVRVSYYKAISRPALYDLTFFNMNYDDYTIAGNPFLQHTIADNFDLRYELYAPGLLDVLQVTAFYKHINHPYEKTLLNAGDTLYPLPSGALSYTPATKITEQLRNFGKAQNYGLELSVVKNISNFSITGNYTFTVSQINQNKKYKQREDPHDVSSDIITVTRQQQRPLQGQSAHLANLNISYRAPRIGWTGQLTGIYTGKRIEDVSGWYDLDSWQKGYTILNFSMEKTFHRHWRAFMRISNLLNAGRTVYLNSAPASGLPGQSDKDKTIIQQTENYRQMWLG
ncbi:TonB-dependent receptor [Danxiaibacter flavus]|uniref:TonB-dependent receptor n=1 Tax=Danxiaibacter flavus TaxID=3049108 RepID=A0ABV3ZI84_9BACT|nr:TonB-dependent receptor [Chitinophagaceae bacterium DXS]